MACCSPGVCRTASKRHFCETLRWSQNSVCVHLICLTLTERVISSKLIETLGMFECMRNGLPPDCITASLSWCQHYWHFSDYLKSQNLEAVVFKREVLSLIFVTNSLVQVHGCAFAARVKKRHRMHRLLTGLLPYFLLHGGVCMTLKTGCPGSSQRTQLCSFTKSLMRCSACSVHTMQHVGGMIFACYWSHQNRSFYESAFAKWLTAL